MPSHYHFDWPLTFSILKSGLKFLLELLKVVLSWPAVILGIFIWFIKHFKEELRELIKRIKTVDVAGVKLGLDKEEAEDVIKQVEKEEADEIVKQVETKQEEDTSSQKVDEEKLLKELQPFVTYYLAQAGFTKRNEVRDRAERLDRFKPTMLSTLTRDHIGLLRYYGARMFAIVLDTAIERYYEADHLNAAPVVS